MHRFKWIAIAAAVLCAAGGWWLAHRHSQQGLLAQASYRVLRQHEPEAWSRVEAAYRRMEETPAARAEFINIANAEFSAAATRRLATASAPAKLALMRDFVANLKLLRAGQKDSCFRYLYPEVAGSADVAREIDANAQARTLALTSEVIRTSAEEPSAAASPEAAAQKLAPVVDAVYAQFGADTQMLAHPREPAVDRRKICDIAISLYERILALPEADAALVFTAVAAP